MPTMQKLYERFMDSIVNSVEFQKLSKIGGHKVYHLEGDALKHSLMVVEEAKKMFPTNYEMWIVALLHDVGKIYTSVCNGPDDWSYPNHAAVGAQHVQEFLPQLSPIKPSKVEWYVANHIKPLFWRGKNLKEELPKLNCPKECSIVNLVKLAICDIQGSVSVVPQTELLAYLYGLVDEWEYALNEASKFGLEGEVEELLKQGYTADEALDECDN